MKILNFIVVDKKLSRGENNFFTVTGEAYISPESIVPVIVSGKGCIGLGVVKALHITSTSTEIEFSFENKISKDKKSAYYDLYRDSLGSNASSDDPYENSNDTFIPGAMGYGAINKMQERDDDYDYDHDIPYF